MKDSNKPLSLTDFIKEVDPGLTTTGFHTDYYRLLEAFARGRIKKLIVTMPPQHGKSVGSSVMMPAYILGLNPDAKVTIASYNATFASRFNRRVQRIIDSLPYASLFPETTIKGRGGAGSYIRQADHVEMVGRKGELISVGRGGSLTGNQVDFIVIDDLYKNAIEANSPTVRDNCWEWYTTVVRTRMHNESAELIVFTRWHEEDLVGLLAEREKFIALERWSQLDHADPRAWYYFNLEAIKASKPTEIDPRKMRTALWPERHGLELLRSKRNLDGRTFEALYQGKPSSAAGLLYGDKFRRYTALPTGIVRQGNYTDTADTGEDYLCSVCYTTAGDGAIYITDVVYSAEQMEVTEGLVAEMLRRNQTREAFIESNNGGRGFARSVARACPLVSVEWFHQSHNKEARIVSNSATVLKFISMPSDWRDRWPDFAAHLTSYRRQYRSNRWHDAPDVLTGIIERELFGHDAKGRIKAYK